MPSYPPKGDWEQQLRGAAARGEEEVRRVIDFLNDEVVPEVRRNGSVALRRAAVELERLARRMEERRAETGSQSAPPKDAPKP